jgi:hypothetical protein
MKDVRWVSAAACALALAAAGSSQACRRAQERWPGPQGPVPSPVASAGAATPNEAAVTPVAAAGAAGAATPGGTPVARVDRRYGPHPRILLDADRLAAVRGLRGAGAPSWRRLSARCDDDVRETIDPGYEAWDWANASLDLALCHAVTRRPEYARAAILYFRALLDDREKVGDRAGGDEVVRHDDGYPIRSHGCFGAIAYDWLHDAPGMTPELRKHAVERFVAWSKWFAAEGYNREQPISNYYVGWFGAAAFAGIAAEGDDPRAADLLRRAQEMYGREVVPAYRKKLAGGDFPEGWQYGDMVGAVLALLAEAASRGTEGRTAFDDLPWLRESVAYRAHALWPDGRHTFDTGDWSDKPAVAPAHAMLALSVALPGSDEAGRRARALARLASDPKEEWLWLATLADDPSRPAGDPRRGETSYFARGTATLTARTDSSPNAVWFALTSAPSISDHQHLDAGHFEIVRGDDALVIDAGGYGSFSSLSHNVIAIDDQKENLNYAPSQGTWSEAATIARHETTERYAYALADYASAYDPAGYPKEHATRSVLRAEREVVFSRAPVAGLAESARVVVYDRITLAKPSYAATFLLHGGAAPETRDGRIRFTVGRSAAYAATLLPEGIAPLFVHEPTNLGDGAYYTNDPPDGTSSVRVEVRAPAGDVERRFLHAIVVGPSQAVLPTATRLDGDGVDGAAIDDEAYVFARAGAQNRPVRVVYLAPAKATHHLVASLAPGGRYAVSAESARGGCRLSVEPGGEGARAASSAGLLAFDVAPTCTLR